MENNETNEVKPRKKREPNTEIVIEETKQGVPETKSEIKEVPPAKKGVSLVKSWKSSLK